MKNRVLILVLSIFMCLSVLPFSAFASTSSEGDDESSMVADEEIIANPAYLEYRISNETVTITGYESTESGKLIIPSELDGYPVVAIGIDAFRYCSKLTEIVLPESIVTIGEYAFRRCTALTAVDIPEGVTEIGKYVFSHCENLTSVTIPEGVTVINEYLFQDCKLLKNVTMGRNVTTICESAFIDCISLETIIIPKTVASIGESAFQNCTSLVVVQMESDVLPENVYENWLNGTTAGIEFGYIYPEDIVIEDIIYPETSKPENIFIQENLAESLVETATSDRISEINLVLGLGVTVFVFIGMIVDRKRR